VTTYELTRTSHHWVQLLPIVHNNYNELSLVGRVSVCDRKYLWDLNGRAKEWWIVSVVTMTVRNWHAWNMMKVTRTTFQYTGKLWYHIQGKAHGNEMIC